jgi:ribosomal-protein-alanine N-acetyltransferase
MLELNFNPFPIIETERLILRQCTHEDTSDFYVLRSDKNVMKYIPRPIAKNHADAAAVIDTMNDGISKNESINWAITVKGNSKLIGVIGYYRTKKEHFRSEIGYILNPTYQGMGIMDEALKAAINFGFIKMKLHSIEAVVDPENLPSRKLLEKNLFIKEAHLKENEFYDGKFLDTIIYSKINSVGK